LSWMVLYYFQINVPLNLESKTLTSLLMVRAGQS